MLFDIIVEHDDGIFTNKGMSYLDLYFVGDVSCGKTTLVKAMKTFPVDTTHGGMFTKNYRYKYQLFREQPHLVVSRLVDERREEDISLRRLGYLQMPLSVLVLCYSVDSYESYRNVKKWLTEIRELLGGLRDDQQIMLLGLKSDLRLVEKAGECVSIKEAKKMARRIGASCYMECSAVSNDGVGEIYEKAYKMLNKRLTIKSRFRRIFKFCLPL